MQGAHTERERAKLDEVAIDGIYMGVCSTTQHSVYIPRRRALETHTNVKLFENQRATHLLEDLLTKSTDAIATSVKPLTLTSPDNRHYQYEEVEVIDDDAEPDTQRHQPQNLENVNNDENLAPGEPFLSPGQEANTDELVQGFVRDSPQMGSTPPEGVSLRGRIRSIPTINSNYHQKQSSGYQPQSRMIYLRRID